ncbi:MAG: 2,3-bisphosphoglycerate-independent phosphoglycerate mutase [Desulfobacterales bacterium]|nr:2,3-bisphosphoglycerate-independent phosphoglycerate mutase [Desulfobacterales bacterium]
MKSNNCCMLMILDGWGINPSHDGNAVYLAGTPNLNKLMQEYPHTQLLCSGEAVGLPQGIMGNSEVGHLNIGAGRIIYQDILRIDTAIRDGSFFKNEALVELINDVVDHGAALHLMGLVSDGGVHSQLSHLLALLDMTRQKGVGKVFVHAILDGRDTPPDSGAAYVKKIQDHLQAHHHGAIATICGRYFAMDRDNRWDRTQKAYRLYAAGEGIKEPDPVMAVKNAYTRGETDEFVKPIVITADAGKAAGTIKDGDSIIFFNFRADRARQITRAFNDPDFNGFKRTPPIKLSKYVTMTQYDETFTFPVAFGPVHRDKILGEVISQAGLEQLRIAETEKYAHVTYFFNGGEEKPFPLEDRCMVPSPRDIPTYDLKPEMSALKVSAEVISRVQSDKYRLIVLNFANMDMVGHTGVLEAAISACQTVDRCVREIVDTVKARGGVVLIAADHGNAEMMREPNGNPHTAHTLNPVPFILVDDTRKNVRLKEGKLGDIAPTILEIIGIDKPEQMTGSSLIIP